MLAHMGTDNTARRVSECIKSDYMALGARVKVKGAQMFFSLILLTNSKGLKRSGWIVRFSTLCSCVTHNGLTLKPQDPLGGSRTGREG